MRLIYCILKFNIFLLLLIQFSYSQTFTKVNSLPFSNDVGYSQACSWGDYNNDGDLDLFVANGTSQWEENNFLYLNLGTGAFNRVTSGTVGGDWGKSSGASWADYDNDGDLDLFVTNFAGQNNFLYANNGDGTFNKIGNSIVVLDSGDSRSCCWGDYDNDGDLDLFVANFQNQNNFFYINNGDGTFSKDVLSVIATDGGDSEGCCWVDYDNDGYSDLFVVNYNGQNNFLYHNEGNSTFAKISNGSIVNDGGNSFGCSWADYNNDGYLDVFVTNRLNENNFLYLNLGNGDFFKEINDIVVNDGGESLGSCWGDFDNDGDQDLVVTNRDYQGNYYYSNNGDGTFSKITNILPAQNPGWSTGTSCADYDNDGYLDLFVSNYDNQMNFLYHNSGNQNHWLNVKCHGNETNFSAVGTKVKIKITTDGIGVWQTQEIFGQTGYLSQNSLNCEFGAGDATIIDSLVVYWPVSQMTTVLTQVPTNQFLVINETLDPVLINISPKSAYQNFMLTMTIVGQNTHFSDGNGTSAIWLEKGSSSIYANNFNVLSNTSLEAEFFVPASVDTGKWDLVVETDLDGVLTMEEGITIYPEPAVAVVSPNFTNPVVIQLNDSVDLDISIGNSGGNALEWTARVTRAPVSPLEKHAARNINGKKPTGGEEAPVLRENESVLFPAPWDLQFGYSLPSLGNAGSEFDGEYFYITKWASNYVDKYDVSGNFIEEFLIPGVSGLRDLAFDGTYMYGGTAGNTIYKMDFTTQTLVGTISSPVIVRHIAYDERYDAFWVGNWSTDIMLVDRSGITLNTIPSYGHGLIGIYGSAYDKWSDGEPYLWVFDQGMGPGTPQYIYQIDLNTGMLTGFAYDVSIDFPQSFGIAGGLFACEGIIPDKATIGGVLQGTPDILFGYELADVGLSWISLLTESGIVEPGGQADLTFRMYGTEQDGDTAYVVIYTNDPMAPVVNVEVIRDVVVGINQPGKVPEVFDVKQNYPNPFNPITIIKYQLPRTSELELQIFNVLGQRVKTLVKGKVQAGYYEAVWNGCNDLGQQVSSGIYIYRFKAADYQKTLKLILLK
jgi:hypothetical protein